jgi:hypothetical protein
LPGRRAGKRDACPTTSGEQVLIMKHALALGLVALLTCPAVAADPPGIKVDKDKKAIIIDAKVAPRKLEKYDQVYPIEVVACWADPKGKKAH